jgi:hypothetical protein
MSTFLKEVNEYQEKMRREAEEGQPLDYNLMKHIGLIKPYTVRLPVTTLAELDELTKFGPWESKQEMIFKIIDGAIRDFLDDAGTGEKVRKSFHEAAKKALDELKVQTGQEGEAFKIYQEGV